ncbi:AAA family ATPase [Mycobacterium sp. 21AC1]|uniref:AAA family ATPase n=1 Tax=[Mycobacterium] appelbergii TaxID=2939269 RepID=UPI00293916AD|nr:AAA family ATPase [Mycobacterium sp. 21AC1]MDV3126177.1 AAA family ATPase [Mycobacterium sp. 21AC1]
MLDLDGQVVGRRQAFTELRAAVEAAGRVGGGCALLSGVPGVGKSTLIHAFGAEVSGRNCVFGYGRCRDGAAAPYSALGEALGAIVRTMDATSPAARDRWRADLAGGASALTGILSELVPDLAPLLGAAPEVADLDVADARRRLQRAAIRLVSITASYRPVVLAVDDLQWADQDTLLLLSELLTVSTRNVLVLGAYRAGEFDPKAAGFTSEGLHRIELSPLSRADLEELLAEVCGRGVELGDVADEFHHRTGGNPLQVRQLLHRAQREGALTPVGASGHPTWDLRVLSTIEVSATAAEFLGRYLDQLRPTDRAVLSSLACFGGEFDLADATAAAAQPADVVAQALWSSLELRLLEAVDSRGQRIANAISREARYRFSHDRVAEAARDGLSATAQRETHLRIGRWFVGQGDDRLFDAARHVGISGAGLADDDERVRFVGVLRRAAAKARAQASFPLALEYCRNGLTLLGEQRWDVSFALTRELQLDAARAALLVGEVTVLRSLLDEAEEFLHEPADRACIAFLRLKGCVAENHLQEALDTGLRALEELGQPVAPDPGKPRMALALGQMKFVMRRWSNDRLLQLPRCEDRLVIEIQRILAELRSMCYIVRPNIFPLVVRKQLDLTLAHGHTPSLPLVLVSYGLLLVMIRDSAGAQRFGEAALMLAERDEFRATRPETLFMHLNFIRHWRHPLQDGLPALRDAVAEALDQGDQEYAGFLAAVLLSQSFWVGRPLPEIDVLARSLIPEVRSQPVPTLLCQAMQQICLNLMGRSDDPYLLAGESGFDEREVVPPARRDGNEVILSTVATQKLGLYFWSGDYAGGAGAVDEAVEHIEGMAATAITQLIHLTAGLCLIHTAPDDRATRRFVRRALSLHRKWAADAPANYAAPYALIQGTWELARGRHRAAEQYLDQAMTLADVHHLPMIGALAHEEAATLYFQTGRATLREHMLRSAFQRFTNLGLTLRVDRLARAYPWLLSGQLIHAGSAGVDPVGARHLVRALSAAETTDALAELVLQTAADITGAQRVLFLSGEADHLMVQAVHEQGTTRLIDGPWTEVPYDQETVRRVMDSGTVLTAAGGELVLVSPILLQDRIIGVLYVERERHAGNFTPEHEETVAYLCAQAAAPLWSLQLEAQLRAADEYRQSLMDVQSRFVPNELLRILDIDDLRRVHSGYRVEREMTVLISDIRGYTTMIEDMNVSEASNLAMGFLRAAEMPIISCNGMIQDVRGDEIVAVFESEPDAVRAGLAMLRSLREHNAERKALGSAELRAGIGINTGAVGVGLVGGVNRMVLTIIGDAVNLAARIESTTKRYGCTMLISDATYQRLADPDQFDIRRMERVLVVNRRRPVTIYEVYDEDPAPQREAKIQAQPAFDKAFALFDAGEVDQAGAAFARCRELLPDDAVAVLHLAHCDAILRGELFPGQGVALQQK